MKVRWDMITVNQIDDLGNLVADKIYDEDDKDEEEEEYIWVIYAT